MRLFGEWQQLGESTSPAVFTKRANALVETMLKVLRPPDRNEARTMFKLLVLAGYQAGAEQTAEMIKNKMARRRKRANREAPVDDVRAIELP